jgi:outer membrane protein assembly factor BamB
VSGDAVYGLGGNGDLVCLDAKSGDIRWQKNILSEFGGGVLGWGICESVLVDEDRLICTPGGNDATIVALDPKTGDVIWKSLVPDEDRAGYSSAAVADVGGVRQYVQLTALGTIGVRAGDGEFLWRENSAANPTANCSSPLVAGNFVFSASNYGTGGALVKLSADDGKVAAERVYHTREMKNHHGDMVIVDGLLYGSNDPGIFTCLELETGKVKWKDRGVGKGSVTYADGRIYLRSEAGKVALVEATGEEYRERGRFDEPSRSSANAWSHPVVAHGRLFLRDQDRLLCYDVRL